jgi:hypothetical protein
MILIKALGEFFGGLSEFIWHEIRKDWKKINLINSTINYFQRFLYLIFLIQNQRYEEISHSTLSYILFTSVKNFSQIFLSINSYRIPHLSILSCAFCTITNWTLDCLLIFRIHLISTLSYALLLSHIIRRICERGEKKVYT